MDKKFSYSVQHIYSSMHSADYNPPKVDLEPEVLEKFNKQLNNIANTGAKIISVMSFKIDKHIDGISEYCNAGGYVLVETPIDK